MRRAFSEVNTRRMTRTFMTLQVNLTVLPTYLGSSAEFTRGVLCSMVITDSSNNIRKVAGGGVVDEREEIATR